ncbi:MAG: hypothetical protein IPK72_03305 [Candidatus Eisenbacteria bacterium]|nr:hypothetical protein [Candidatus Eisenbacteria bacterium]
MSNRHVIARASRTLRLAGMALVLLLVVACAPGRQSFRAPGPGLSSGTVIAVLPLANLTQDETADYIFTQKILVELGLLDHFRVQDPGLVTGALRQLRILDPDRMSAEQMEGLATRVGADFLLAGVITEFAEGADRPRGLPAAALTLRIINASNGDVVWAGSRSAEGDDGETFFGLGRVRTADRLAANLAHDLVGAMKSICVAGPPLEPLRRAAKEID